ncbi:hypothetical protein HAX54_052053 [Datura stramonium]|uniref:Uncharacterized protein n=1 Tax=Datura stramonium TaxID=4076 RepID=A0ABS8WQC9_DATST|nr:hypothetical protein [Datura stramonium]
MAPFNEAYFSHLFRSSSKDIITSRWTFLDSWFLSERTLIGEGLQLSLRNNKELKAQINFQEFKILVLNVELARRMEELVSTGHIENLKADLEKAKLEHVIAFQELNLANREILTSKAKDLKILRDKALANLKDQEDHLALKSKLITWSVQRNTLKQSKACIDDINAKILEAQKLETACDNLPPPSRLCPTSLSSFFDEEEDVEPATPDFDIPPSNSYAPLLGCPKL